MNTTLTLESVKQEVRAKLGAGSVNVELVESDLLVCLRDAVREYNRNRPMRANHALAATVGQKRYQIDHPGLQGVVSVSVISPNDRVDPDSIGFEMLDRTGLSLAGDTFGDIFQRRVSREQSEETISAESEWHGEWDRDGKYYLYLDVRRAPRHVSYTYTWHVTPDDDPNTGMKFIPDGDVQWILDYTLARAKYILGRVRGKFEGILNSEGATDPVDWSKLLEEGEQETAQLKEALSLRRRPLPPIIG